MAVKCIKCGKEFEKGDKAYRIRSGTFREKPITELKAAIHFPPLEDKGYCHQERLEIEGK